MNEKDILKSKIVSVDTETDADQPPCKTRLKGVSIAWGDPTNPEGQYWSFERDPSAWPAFRKTILAPLFARKDVDIFFWNAKFDLQVLGARDLKPKGRVIDAMMLHYLIDEGDDHGLKDRARADLDAKDATSHAETKKELKTILKKGQQVIKAWVDKVWIIYKRDRLKSELQEARIGAEWPLVKKVACRLPPGMLKADVLAHADAKIRPVVEAEYLAKHDARFAEYGRNDAIWTLQLGVRYMAEVEKRGHLPLFFDLEMPVVRVIEGMETRGVKLDAERLRKLKTMYKKAQRALLVDLHRRHGSDFNPASSDQLRKLFWIEKGIEPPKWAMTTKKAQETGDKRYASVNADVLNWVAEECKDKDAIDAVRLRRLDKMIGTYIEPLYEIAKTDGQQRVHTSFNPVGTPNDRLSSSEPNLQNIPRPGTTEDALPKAPSLRTVFIPEKGYSFIVADFSQIELRLMAHYSQDENLLAAYRTWHCFTCGSSGDTDEPFEVCPNCWEERLEWRKAEKAGKGFALGKDIHWETALACGLVENYGPEEGRQRAKSTNFGLLYGMGPKLLAKQIDVPLEISEEVHEKYFDRYSNVRAFHKWVERTIIHRGWFRLFTSRVRHFLREKSAYSRGVYDGQDAWLFYAVVREATNAIIQGGAAGLMKMAMRNLSEKLVSTDKFKDAGIVLQVHDELIIEAPDEVASEIATLTRQMMERAGKIRVPVLADVKYGKEWTH